MKLLTTLLFILFATTVTLTYSQDNKNTPDKNYLHHDEPSERLVTIMRRLFSSVHDERIEENLAFTETDLVNISEAVEELLFYAELMSAKVPETNLEKNDSIIFSAMANQLYSESLNIQQLAKGYNLDHTNNEKDNILYDAFERMNQTCVACHQLFRDK